MSALVTVCALVLRLLAQVSVAVSAPAEVAPRDPVLVKVEVTAPAGRDVQIVPPDFAPFRVLSALRVGTVDSMPPGSAALRAPWQIVEHRWVLAPPVDASGRFAFAPFVARVTGAGARATEAPSRAWSVTVRPPPPAPNTPTIVDRMPARGGSGIEFHAMLLPDTVYVGQQATYQVAVYLDDDVRARLRRNPEFLPPELRGLLAYDLPAGRASVRGRVFEGRRWDVHVFQRAVFPLQPGRIDIPGAQLSYSLPLSAGFFSREESYTTRSESAHVVAIAPPTAGRPGDWTGAVGVLRASARVDSSDGRVGQPLVLTLRVEGTGNVKLLPRPALALPWATLVPADERVQVDSSALLVRGAKEFDWLVTPTTAGARETGPIRYAYFDPYARRYDAAVTTSVPVRVAPGALAAATSDSARDAAPLAVRALWTGERPAPLATRPPFWWLLGAGPVPALLALFATRPRRAAPRRTPAASLRALASARAARAERGAAAVRRAYVAALEERLALPPGCVAAGDVARRLRRAGVSAAAAQDAATLLVVLDEAAFAGADASPALAGRALAAFQRVDAEARDRLALAETRLRERDALRAAGRVGALVVLAATALVPALLAARAPAPAAFERGVVAYRAHRWQEARARFAESARTAPRAPDAWANLGTAAWAAGDTASAAFGWQRAMRLDPLAADVRERLAMLPTVQEGTVAGVPQVPPEPLTAAALALWTVAGLAVALAVVARRAPATRTARAVGGWIAPAAMALGAAAVVAVGASVTLARVTSPVGLAIVRTSGALRSEPALGADAGAPAQVSDVARVLARQAAWVRVRLDGDRDGWIESDRLAPLDGLP